MQQYIGTKLINAESMTRAEYNVFRGWELPEDEDGRDAGYLVEYVDGGKANTEKYKGYVSWSPKVVFLQAYREIEGLTFGQAVEAAKLGLKVAREGWNGSGMFAYIMPAMGYPPVSQHMIEKFGIDGALVPCRACWALWTAQKDVAMWSPSGSDSLAEDWFIVD